MKRWKVVALAMFAASLWLLWAAPLPSLVVLSLVVGLCGLFVGVAGCCVAVEAKTKAATLAREVAAWREALAAAREQPSRVRPFRQAFAGGDSSRPH